MQIEIGRWDAMKDEARAIRYQVFVVEQRVPVELEWDEVDPQCIHALARDAAGQAVATGRLLPDGHIGRMAVLAGMRGRGVGSAVLATLIEAARKRGDRQVLLNAQISAVPFYTRFGFALYGDEFLDAGIRHQAMQRSL